MADTPTLDRAARRYAVALVYLSGFLQGLTLVSFPASGALLKQTLGFNDAQYGAIFLPQVGLAILGALLGASLARRIGLKTLLVIALLANGLSQLALAASLTVMAGLGFTLILAATGALGLGFGLAGAPINTYPTRLFPRQSHAAVVALHTLLGLGLAAGPLAAGAFMDAGVFTVYPVLTAGLCGALAGLTFLARLPAEAGTGAASTPGPLPLAAPGFWGFALVAVLYAFAEGTFSNWVVIYLNETKGLPQTIATLALSAFWAALVVGRLTAAALVVRVAPERLWLALPLLMIAAFLLLPYADSAGLGVMLFALAGLGCSAFFPLTITLAAHRFPQHVAAVSSMMIAALMVGVGAGSFVIGALRALLPLETLYQLSAVYPLAVLIIAGVLARGETHPQSSAHTSRVSS